MLNRAPSSFCVKRLVGHNRRIASTASSENADRLQFSPCWRLSLVRRAWRLFSAYDAHSKFAAALLCLLPSLWLTVRAPLGFGPMNASATSVWTHTRPRSVRFTDGYPSLGLVTRVRSSRVNVRPSLYVILWAIFRTRPSEETSHVGSPITNRHSSLFMSREYT